MANLGPQKQSTSYLGLLQVPDGLTTVLKNVTDGLGASTPLQLSTTNIGFSSLTMTGPINMGGYQINNLGAPTASTDAVTKAYVDSVATGLQPKQQCVAGTVANITLSGEQNIDDIDVVAGDRVLVKNQSIQANNGIYIVGVGAWTRSSDTDTWTELVGAYVFIVGGTVNTATSWVCNSPVNGTLGSTAVTWIKFSSSTSTLSNYLTFDALGDGDQGYTDIATENGYNILTEDNDFLTIQTPGLIEFNGSSPVLISYNSIGAIALDGSNASPGSTWNINVYGNAGTVTDGVYTTGSYSNPAWITAIASSKLIGAVDVNHGGTGSTTLNGILFGNGSSAVTTATAADIVSAIGSTAVANATNAVNATTATTAITATTATTTTQTDFSNLTIGGSQVIDVANIGTYAPVTFINVLTYGAYNNNTNAAANTAAIQACINANPYRTIYFPAGQYAVNSITVTTGITLIGDNQNSSAFFSSNATGNVFTFNTTAPCRVSNLTFSSNVTRLSGAYINVTTASGENQYSSFDNVAFIGGYDGIHFTRASDWTISGCQFQQNHYACIVENQNNADSGDSTILSTLFSIAPNGIGIIQYSSGGLKVEACKFLGGAYHYYGTYSTAMNDLILNGNSSEDASSANFCITGSSGGTIDGVVISNNQITVANANANGIYFVNPGNPGWAVARKTTISANMIQLRGSDVAINIQNGTQISVMPNTITATQGNSGNNTHGVRINTSASAISLWEQQLDGMSSGYEITTSSIKYQGGWNQTGTGSGFVTSNNYGSPLFRSDAIAVSFPKPYPIAPVVTANIFADGSHTNNGGVSCLITNPTTTGFNIYLIGVSASATTSYCWTSSLGNIT